MRRHAPLLDELRKLVRLALPLAAVQAGNQLIVVVDTAIVGRLGATPLGAVGLGNGIFFVLSTLGFGTMLGLDPLIAQAIGAGETDRARRLLWQGVWLAAGLTLVLSVPIAITPFFLEPAGIEGKVARLARVYALARLPGLFPFLLFLGMRSYLQALGVTRPLLIATIGANVLNVPVSLLLVFGGEGLPHWMGPLELVPPLGIVGAAVAANLFYALQPLVLGAAIARVGSAASARRPDGAELRSALRVGVPVGLQMAAETAIFAFVGFLAGRLGAGPLAAHQIALTLAAFTFTVAVGVATAASVRVGIGIGAGDPTQVRRAGYLGLAAGAGVMALGGLCFLLFPTTLASLLTNDAETIERAVPLLGVAALFSISDGVQAVGAGILRGAGDTRFTFAVNLVGHWLVGLPLALWLSPRLGVSGLWLGLSAGLTVVACALALRFRRIAARPIRRIAPAEAA